MTSAEDIDVPEDGGRAKLKPQMPREETAAALIGLRAWKGDGIVRLLDHDPESSAMLLERLNASRSLASVVDDDTALGTLAALMARLHAAPAPAGLRRLDGIARDMLAAVPQALVSLSDPDDQRRLHTWAAAVAELVDEPGDRLLHFGNVLAAEREPWLAIDPEPLFGDPGFDLWPALDTGWEKSETTGDARRVVRRRFDLLTEALELVRRLAGPLITSAATRPPSGGGGSPICPFPPEYSPTPCSPAGRTGVERAGLALRPPGSAAHRAGRAVRSRDVRASRPAVPSRMAPARSMPLQPEPRSAFTSSRTSISP
ncbi:hypothetical protein GCM10010302_42950 [Streptomyces polychromogenes]|uniref:Uncharacterized protein n=1 Tax=Streptomyces polychromogenes TaxID=67342 RepID=A0ABN0VGR5_9ACTN